MLIFVSLVLISCESRKTEITEDIAVAFAKEIEREVITGNEKTLINKFDVEGFEKRCLQEINNKGVKKPLRELKRKYLQESVSVMELFFENLIHNVKDGGYFKFSKYYFDEKSHHLIFSSYSWIGVNFIDFRN